MPPIRQAFLRVALLFVLSATLTACRGDEQDGGPPGGQPPEPQATRPAGVPPGARHVLASERLDGDAPGVLLTMSCSEDLLNIVTTGHVLYAELPCDRALPQDQVQTFLGEQVEIHISIAAGGNKLRVDSSEAGLVEFSPAGVWVAENE